MVFTAAEILNPARQPESLASTPAQLRRVRRVYKWRRGGMAVGFAVATLLFLTNAFQTGAGKTAFLLIGPLLGACVVAAILISELLIATPTGSLRSARLKQRRIRDYVSRTQTLLLTALTIGFLLLMVGTTAAFLNIAPRIPSDEVRGDWGPTPPEFVFLCPSGLPEDADFWGITNIPWILSVAAVGLGLSLFALRRIATRPPYDSDPTLQDADERQRESSAGAVVQACGVLLTSSSAACAYFMSNAFSFTCQSSHTLILGNVMQVFSYMSTAALIYFLITLARACSPRVVAQ
ncbi:hypothetical protein AMK27_36005 [Streptomyces sp. CB02009]|nr:hypothetical protein AMK27_36005 [Streptomyces sp. CB02009]